MLGNRSLPNLYIRALEIANKALALHVYEHFPSDCPTKWWGMLATVPDVSWENLNFKPRSPEHDASGINVIVGGTAKIGKYRHSLVEVLVHFNDEDKGSDIEWVFVCFVGPGRYSFGQAHANYRCGKGQALPSIPRPESLKAA